MGENYTKEAYEIIYKHPQWKSEAAAYEEKMAARLFHDSYTKAAVKTALGRISRVLTDYYRDGEKPFVTLERQTVEDLGAITDVAQTVVGNDSDVQVNNRLVDALMQERDENTPDSQNKTSAGQVPKVTQADLNPDRAGETYTEEEAYQKNMQTLDEVINGDGNLREQMAFLYNGLFINGGRSTEQIEKSTSLKGMFMKITKEEAQQKNSEALQGIDFDLLEGQGNYQKGDVFDTYHLARDLERRNEKREGKGNIISRWWRGIKRAYSAAFGNHYKRIRLKGNNVREGLGLRHYEDLGIGLSERERALSVREVDGQQKLLWKEGTSYARPKKLITANGMLQTAGTSGTALRMLGSYRLLGASKQDLLNFRLALIAWMVSSHDHSLYEILKGSHNAGVKGSEDLSEAANMYMNIDPLDTDMLREQFAENKEFPHEKVYKVMLNELTEARYRKEQEKDSSKGNQEKRETYKAIKEQLAMLEEVQAKNEAEYKKISAQIGSLIKQRSQATPEDRKNSDESLRELYEKAAGMEEDIRLIKRKVAEVKEKKDGLEEVEDITLFSDSGLTYGDNALQNNAQNLALNVYTTQAYMSMNEGQKWGSIVAKVALKWKGYLGERAEEKADSKLFSQIYDMVRVSARMSQDALVERGTREATQEAENRHLHASDRRTYRGEKSGGGNYRTAGYEYTIGSLTSSSKSLDQALQYYANSVNKYGANNTALVIYQLNGHGAVDITDMSAAAHEEEILIPAGTRVAVEQPLVKNVSTDAIRAGDNTFTSEAVSDDQIKSEFAQYKMAGENVRMIRHVNVVRVTEIDGPGSRRRRERQGNTEEERQRRNQVRQSLLASLRNNRAAGRN